MAQSKIRTNKGRAPKQRSKIGTGPRAGKRSNKLKIKTAKAMGRNRVITKPWRQRKQEGDY